MWLQKKKNHYLAVCGKRDCCVYGGFLFVLVGFFYFFNLFGLLKCYLFSLSLVKELNKKLKIKKPSEHLCGCFLFWWLSSPFQSGWFLFFNKQLIFTVEQIMMVDFCMVFLRIIVHSQSKVLGCHRNQDCMSTLTLLLFTAHLLVQTQVSSSS